MSIAAKTKGQIKLQINLTVFDDEINPRGVAMLVCDAFLGQFDEGFRLDSVVVDDCVILPEELEEDK